MKAITILQPWASLIACGAKKIETRNWVTKYRGPIAIHAGRGYGPVNRNVADAIEGALFYTNYAKLFPDQLPRGQIIAIAELTDCIKMTEALIKQQRGTVQGLNELAFGYFEPGRYAWVLDNVRQIDPVPAKGMQRIWNWEGKYS